MATGEKVLAAELLICVGVETADALANAYTGKFSLPKPSRYFATIVVFLFLSAAALFGENPAKLAQAFGGLATAVILLAPTTPGGKPVVVSALNYFAQLYSAPSLGQQLQGQSTPAAQSSPGGNYIPTTNTTPTPGTKSVGGSPGAPTVIQASYPGALTGVDLSGNLYTRQTPTGPWSLASVPAGPQGQPMLG